MSYSLYLLHIPLLYMFFYWWDDNASVGVFLAALALVFLLCYFFSALTEGRRSSVANLVVRENRVRRPAQSMF